MSTIKTWHCNDNGVSKIFLIKDIDEYIVGTKYNILSKSNFKFTDVKKKFIGKLRL